MREISSKYAETGACAPKDSYSADANINPSKDTE